MLISTIEELRLHFSAHALDSLEPLAGILDNSEHECLQEKLGADLYQKLCDHYKTVDVDDYLEAVYGDGLTSCYDKLLFIAQRIIVFDSFARAIGVMPLSVNNAGVNVTVTDDYQKPDKDAIATFRSTCYAELASSVNRLLQMLEELVMTGTTTDEKAIANSWKSSRYYYLVAELLIPSAKVLQEYVDIHENRLKFIQMVPDLRFIQEDVIAEQIGEDFMDHLVASMAGGTLTTAEGKVVHKLRKAMARYLVERSKVLSMDKDSRVLAHDEAVALMSSILGYLPAHQSDFTTQYIQSAPWYKEPEQTAEIQDLNEIPQEESFNSNKRKAFFAMPGLV